MSWDRSCQCRDHWHMWSRKPRQPTLLQLQAMLIKNLARVSSYHMSPHHSQLTLCSCQHTSPPPHSLGIWSWFQQHNSSCRMTRLPRLPRMLVTVWLVREGWPRVVRGEWMTLVDWGTRGQCCRWWSQSDPRGSLSQILLKWLHQELWYSQNKLELKNIVIMSMLW